MFLYNIEHPKKFDLSAANFSYHLFPLLFIAKAKIHKGEHLHKYSGRNRQEINMFEWHKLNMLETYFVQ